MYGFICNFNTQDPSKHDRPHFSPTVFYMGEMSAVACFNSLSVSAVIVFIAVVTIYFIYYELIESLNFSFGFSHEFQKVCMDYM